MTAVPQVFDSKINQKFSPRADRIVAGYNKIQSDSMAIVLGDGSFKDLAQLSTDDVDFFSDPFIIIPRLIELADWMIYPSKNTNVYLAKMDDTFRMLFELYKATVIGDGMRVKVFTDDDLKEIEMDLTKGCEEWLNAPCGISGDNAGKTMESWIIPMVLFEGLTCGGSAVIKWIGNETISPPEEVGKFMIRHIDSRSYVKIHHDFYGYSKLIQFPITQYNLPKSIDEFSTWMPALRNRFQHLSGPGANVDRGPVHIPSDQYYWFNLFLWPPMNTVLQKIISKMVLLFFQDKFIEKATFPFFVVKVPRNYQIDPDDASFKDKLNEVAKLISEYRSGDVIAIEGETYDTNNAGEKIILSDGWEIVPLEVSQASINFSQMFQSLDEGIARGVLSTMMQISNIGVQGRSSSLSTGGSVNANIDMIRKETRKILASVFKFILRDFMKHEFDEDVSLRRIDIDFTKVREEDAVVFLNQLMSYHGAGAMLTNELRSFATRLGMDLPPLPPEMTPEGKEALGIEEMMNESAFQIPHSWLAIDSPEIEMEKVRDELQEEQDNIEKSVNESKENRNDE